MKRGATSGCPAAQRERTPSDGVLTRGTAQQAPGLRRDVLARREERTASTREVPPSSRVSTWLMEGGVSDTVVANLLGHADTKMRYRLYGKPREDAMAGLLVRQSAPLPRERVVYVS